MNKTAVELTTLSDEELGRVAAEVLVPKPWKHNVPSMCLSCEKCGERLAKPGRHGFMWREKDEGPCTIPDPIDVTDWNVAMEWRDKALASDRTEDECYKFIGAMEAIWKSGEMELCYDQWLLWEAQPRHYLIAAILAVGATK